MGERIPPRINMRGRVAGMENNLVTDTMVAAYDAQVKRLQTRIAELEAEITRQSQQYQSRLTGQSMVIQARERTIEGLLVDISALRQPCRHADREPGCAWCRVRTAIEETLREQGGSFDRFSTEHVMDIFDAAVLAVREGRG